MDVVDNRQLGRAKELDRLYRDHSRWLKAELCRAGLSSASEDLVQEAFLRISRYPASIPIAFPKALLLKIARNVARSTARRVRKADSLRKSTEVLADAHGHGPDQFATVVLHQTILSLPEIYRDVFMLSRFGGMSYQEIAEAKGLAVKTVEWRMTRALAMCAARMRE